MRTTELSIIERTPDAVYQTVRAVGHPMLWATKKPQCIVVNISNFVVSILINDVEESLNNVRTMRLAVAIFVVAGNSLSLSRFLTSMLYNQSINLYSPMQLQANKYNTIRYKTYNAPYVTKMLFVGANNNKKCGRLPEQAIAQQSWPP